MIGTIVNTTAIICGTIIGSVVKKGISEKQSETVMQAMGLSALAIGLHSTISNMDKSTLPVLFIVSLAIGGFIGQSLKLPERIDKLGEKVKKTCNIQGVITAVLLFCFGTLSILGPIESAINNNNNLLYTNAMLDFVTSIVLSSSFGFSILFSAIILFCWQGSIYLVATLLQPFLTDALMAEIGIVGGILILSTGLSILKVLKIEVIKFLPALLVPPLFFILKGIIHEFI